MAMAEESFSHDFARSMRLQEEEIPDPHLLIRSASVPPRKGPVGADLPRVSSHDSSLVLEKLVEAPVTPAESHLDAFQAPGPSASSHEQGHFQQAQNAQQQYQQQMQQQQQQHIQSTFMYGYTSPVMQPLQAGGFELTSSPYMGPVNTTLLAAPVVPSPNVGPYTPHLLPHSLFGTPPFGHQQYDQGASTGYMTHVYSPPLVPGAAYYVPGSSMHQQAQAQAQAQAQEQWMYGHSPSMGAVQTPAPPPLQMQFTALPPAAISQHQASPTESSRCLRVESTGHSLGGNRSRGKSGSEGKGSVNWGEEAAPPKRSSLLEELKSSSKSMSGGIRGNSGGAMHVQTQAYEYAGHHQLPNHHASPIHGYNQESPHSAHPPYYGNTPVHGGNGNEGRRHTPGRAKSPGQGMMMGLRNIIGKVCEFARDQHGSRFIQQQLESPTVSAADKQALFEEVLPVAHDLAQDVFGNYVIQKLLAEGKPGQQEKLVASALQGRMLELSKHMFACRVVQKLIEKVFSCRDVKLRPGEPGSTLYDPAYQNSLLMELEGSIMVCVQDQNGNHVIQKCIEQVRPIERIRFILDAFQGNMVTMAMHPYGCRVAQRVMENCDERRVKAALSELIESIDRLVNDQYANYVCQHIIEQRNKTNDSEERKLVLKAVRENVFTYSMHKYASNVVERCIQFGEPSERREIIEKMLERTSGERRGSCPLVPMMQDKYANYVVQKVIDTAEPDQQRRVVQLVRDNAAALKKLTYGKHILARLDKVDKKT